MSIYDDLRAAGCTILNHESDLHVEATATARMIIAHYEFKNNCRTFQSLVDGKMWIDVPFAFDPWWEKHGRKKE